MSPCWSAQRVVILEYNISVNEARSWQVTYSYWTSTVLEVYGEQSDSNHRSNLVSCDHESSEVRINYGFEHCFWCQSPKHSNITMNRNEPFTA